MKKGKIIIFAAPSGSGKSTMVNYIRKNFDCEFSVSATTRDIRPGEIDGKDYIFYNESEFKKLIKEGAFVEYEEVYPGKFYGTLKSNISNLLEKGKNLIFDVDVIGGLNIKKMFPFALSIYVKVSNTETIKQRLIKRGTETNETLYTRLNKIKEESKYQEKYDYILLNDNIENAYINIYKKIDKYLNEI